MTESPATINAPLESPKVARRSLHIGVVRFSAAQFLIALILFCASAPLVPETENGRLVESVLLTFVLLSGVMAVGWRRRTLLFAAILVLPALVGRWLNHYRPELIPQEASLTCGLIFVIFVAVKLLQFVLRAPRVNAEVLYAGVSGYLLLGLIWSFAYLLVVRVVPYTFAFNGTPVASSAMTSFDSFYFSFVTLSTVGYGDVTPLSRGARTLAVMEAMTGTLYVAVLIARLVALYSTQKPEPEKKSSPESI